jgi:dTDP-4-dehydrorhamnose reductase
MAGHTIALYLQEKGHDVFGFDLNKSKYINSFACNALDTDTVSKAITSGNYDAVINCIGVLNQFAEQNKALAAFLNSYFPHFLAQITAGSDTQVIHMSTDCVFSGRRGAYTEDDIPDGVSFYDRSKALGELDDDKNITLRNSIVGPDINQRGIGLLNWFLQQKDSINGFTKSMWTGQTTLQLAKTMEAAAMERAHGLYNTVPDSPISKYDLCVLFNKSFRNGRISIHPVDGVVADKSLKRTRYDFAYRIPDYETMVSELADWVYRHKEMYPHYCL